MGPDYLNCHATTPSYFLNRHHDNFNRRFIEEVIYMRREVAG